MNPVNTSVILIVLGIIGLQMGFGVSAVLIVLGVLNIL